MQLGYADRSMKQLWPYLTDLFIQAVMKKSEACVTCFSQV